VTTTDGETPEALMTRFDALAADLQASLGTDATVQREVLAAGKIGTVSIGPEPSSGLGAVWLVMGRDA
jgi:hypothetical protein